MIRFFKAFPKFIKTAFLSIFRHIAMSLSASSAVTITLILFSAFLMIAGNVSLFTNSIEDDLQIHVVLKADVKTQKKIDEAKDGLEKISGVRRVTFSDKDNELELMIKEKGKEFEMYRGKDNPLCNAFFVSVKDANQIKAINAQIEQLPFVKQSVLRRKQCIQNDFRIEYHSLRRTRLCRIADTAGTLPDIQFHKADNLCEKCRNIHYAKRRCGKLVHKSSIYD